MIRLKTDIFKYFLLTSICFSSCVSAQAMSLEEYIAQENPQDAPYIAQAIYDTSSMYGVDPLVMASIFYVESRYNNNAVSPAGALGIAQLMPGTASDLGVNPYDIYQNIEGGTRYFKELLDSQNPSDPYRYNLALSSYNAGPGNVNGYSPTYTYDYIQTVTDTYNDIVQHVDPTTPVRSTPNYVKSISTYLDENGNAVPYEETEIYISPRGQWLMDDDGFSFFVED